jgi:wyosine [tRNA(Phe)-imidazoG37] synthetase (radical SAM superfamily)
LDCVFCQLGRTRNKTIRRKDYVPTDVVLAELKDWLKTNGEADYITLSGSGEPTLHSHFGEVIAFIHKNSTIPTVLLTNGTMLHLPEVREAAAKANVVKVSLSAWDQASYAWVNRPHPGLRFDQLLEGQKALRASFKGQLWMEVFIVKAVNAMSGDVYKIATLAKEVAPDRIQLNTAVRPPAEDFVIALSREELAGLCHLFHPKAEIITEYRVSSKSTFQASQDTLLSMLQRRPCTMNEIAAIFDMHLNEVSKYLGNLMDNGRIYTTQKNGTVYYAGVRTKPKENITYTHQYNESA